MSSFYDPKSYISKFHKIKLEATEYVEPHRGHEMWLYRFYIDNDLVENKHIKYSDMIGGLEPDLSGFQFEEDTGHYVCIPIEGKMLLYEVATKHFFSMRSKGTLGNEFIRNVFSENRLIVVRRIELIIINLFSKYQQSIIFPFKAVKLNNAFYLNDLLIIEYKDLKDYKTYTKRYDFNKMDFEI